MFTATKLGDSINKQTRRRVVTVRFSDGESEFEKDFSFNVEMTEMEMKKVVKQYLDELNYVAPVIADGVIDVSDVQEEPVTPEPTPAELAKTQFDADVAKLEQIKKYIDLGVLTGNEAPVVALRNKVKADFKPAYIA